MEVERDALVSSLTEIARDIFNASACSVAVLAGELLEFRAAAGAGAEELIGVRMSSTKGIAGWAVTSGQAIVVADVTTDSRFDRVTAAQTGYLPDVIMAAPLIHDEQALGVIEVLDPRPGPLGEDRGLELLGRFADHAAMIVAAFEEAGVATASPEQALLQAALDYARERQA